MAWKDTLRYAWRFPEGTVVLRIEMDLVGRADPDRFRTAPGFSPVLPRVQPLHGRFQPVEARWRASGQLPIDDPACPNSTSIATFSGAGDAGPRVFSVHGIVRSGREHALRRHDDGDRETRCHRHLLVRWERALSRQFQREPRHRPRISPRNADGCALEAARRDPERNLSHLYPEWDDIPPVPGLDPLQPK
jgi:hypothetical protein